MTMAACATDPEAVKGPLRTELGCIEPLCMLSVTVTEGSLILTVVATDTAPNSQVHTLANTMKAKARADLRGLGAMLGLVLVEVPTVQSPVTLNVVVVLPAPAPPPPLPNIALQTTESAISAEEAARESTAIGGLAAGLACSVLAGMVVAYLLYRRMKIKRANAKLSSPVPVEMMSTSSVSHEDANVPANALVEENATADDEKKDVEETV